MISRVVKSMMFQEMTLIYVRIKEKKRDSFTLCYGSCDDGEIVEINNEVGSISQGDNELIMSSDFESCEKDDELTQIEKHNESAYSDEDEFESEITVQDEDDGLENVEILDEIVRDVAVGMTNVEIEPSLSDMSEMKLVEEFARRGCGCQLLSGEQCCKCSLLNIFKKYILIAYL